MSIEGQPNTILEEYSPFAWIQDTTTGTTTGNSFTILNTNFLEKNTASSLTIGSTNAGIDIGTGSLRTTQISIGSNSGGVASTGNVNIMTGSKQSGNFNLLSRADSVNTGVITLGNTYGKIRLFSQLDRAIPMAVNNITSVPSTLTGYTTDTYTLATGTINGYNRYIYAYAPAIANTGNYMVNICITFECSSNFSPWLQFAVYRKASTILPNNSVLTELPLTNFSVIQKFYTTILTDKMTVNMSGVIDFNPFQNGTVQNIGVAVKWLEFVSGGFTLAQVNTVLTAVRLA